jgi:hypothetical protein
MFLKCISCEAYTLVALLLYFVTIAIFRHWLVNLLSLMVFTFILRTLSSTFNLRFICPFAAVLTVQRRLYQRSQSLNRIQMQCIDTKVLRPTCTPLNTWKTFKL